MKRLSPVALLGLLFSLSLMPASQSAAQTVAPSPTQVGPFENEIKAFEASDKKSPPPTGAVLFLGSSSIRLWETLPRDFPELPVINRGFGGSQIADSARYADRIVIPYKPRLIVFYAGGNDINAGKSPAQVAQAFKNFVAKVHAALPDTRIAYVSINPSVARWAEETKVNETNRLISAFVRTNASRRMKLSFLETHSPLLGVDGKPRPSLLRADGLHLNAQGYKLWTAILRPQVLALATQEGVRTIPATSPH